MRLTGRDEYDDEGEFLGDEREFDDRGPRRSAVDDLGYGEYFGEGSAKGRGASGAKGAAPAKGPAKGASPAKGAGKSADDARGAGKGAGQGAGKPAVKGASAARSIDLDDDGEDDPLYQDDGSDDEDDLDRDDLDGDDGEYDDTDDSDADGDDADDDGDDSDADGDDADDDGDDVGDDADDETDNGDDADADGDDADGDDDEGEGGEDDDYALAGDDGGDDLDAFGDEDDAPAPAPARGKGAAAARAPDARRPAARDGKASQPSRGASPGRGKPAPAEDDEPADDTAHPIEALVTALEAALEARASDLPAPDAQAALRLFSGFYEGYPSLTIDLYGSTVLFHDHSSRGNEVAVRAALDVMKRRLPWVRAGLWKLRKSPDPAARGGRIVLGSEAILADRVREDGVWYALDLTHHQDATFYLDTRPLRSWLKANMRGKTLLNTFAYTGSLGVAALAGGATRALQLDRNGAFLDIARRSSQLNGLVVKRRDLVSADFFEHIGRLKSEKALFDAVIVDPPFFARSDRARVDQEAESLRLLNKVRPLIADGGVLIAVNNALYLPGATFHAQLQSLTTDLYLQLETLLEIPADITGYPATRVGAPPADPSPFNHATKIAILRVRRKDRQKATPPPA